MEKVLELAIFILFLAGGALIHELAHTAADFVSNWVRGGFKQAIAGLSELSFSIEFGDRKPSDSKTEVKEAKNQSPMFWFDFAICVIAGPFSHIIVTVLALYFWESAGFFAICWVYLGIANLFGNKIFPDLLAKMGAKDGQQLCFVMAFSNSQLTAKLMIPSFWRAEFFQLVNLPRDKWDRYWTGLGRNAKIMNDLQLKFIAALYYCTMGALVLAPLTTYLLIKI